MYPQQIFRFISTESKTKRRFPFFISSFLIQFLFFLPILYFTDLDFNMPDLSYLREIKKIIIIVASSPSTKKIIHSYHAFVLGSIMGSEPVNQPIELR